MFLRKSLGIRENLTNKSAQKGVSGVAAEKPPRSFYHTVTADVRRRGGCERPSYGLKVKDVRRATDEWRVWQSLLTERLPFSNCVKIFPEDKAPAEPQQPEQPRIAARLRRSVALR